MTIRSVPENGSRFAMLQAGEAQYATVFPPELVPVAEKLPNLEVVRPPVHRRMVRGHEHHEEAVQTIRACARR